MYWLLVEMVAAADLASGRVRSGSASHLLAAVLRVKHSSVRPRFCCCPPQARTWPLKTVPKAEWPLRGKLGGSSHSVGLLSALVAYGSSSTSTRNTSLEPRTAWPRIRTALVAVIAKF